MRRATSRGRDGGRATQNAMDVTEHRVQDERGHRGQTATDVHAGDVRPRIEMWAGVECTVNRVGDRYHDQIARSGHAEREDDLDRLAALGVAAVRYPVLWERHEPHEGAAIDWTWTDRRLERLRALGVRPIVTLVHHGSGPRDTSLLDPRFPERLARFAGALAARHPWLEDWTPVNEPLTTARFSALYGLWYPHARDDRSFARALLTQLRAVREAMRAVRAIIPRARLVQTEDLGKTHATPPLRYQARFENARRWLTFDVLAGRLGPRAPMWRFLRTCGGLSADELESFLADPCPPDVLGVNHYLTSERFLDHRRARYPAHTHGGNGRHRYADVEAVRVRAEGCDGPARLLGEAWRRYGLPIAVTEAHLDCTREQQLRWLAEVWRAAHEVRAAGGDVRAVTAWSAFGAFDWPSLLTRDEGRYEPGLFDVRGGHPRPTALAHMVRDLATAGIHGHPALTGPGWWRMPERLIHAAVPTRAPRRPRGPHGAIVRRAPCEAPRTAAAHAASVEAPAIVMPTSAERAELARAAELAVPLREAEEPARPVLVTGARGTLGRAIARACALRGLACVETTRTELDIADERAVRAAIERWRPWAIVNAAGFVRVDDAEREREACWRDNVAGPVALARASAALGVRLATLSSDLVFDGERNAPYVEGDATSPLSCYGASKAAAEEQVQRLCPDALVVRTSAFFGPRDEWNFLTRALRALGDGRPFAALADVVVSPTYVPDLVDALLDLLVDGERGLWHLANDGALTWLDFARRAAALAGLDADLVTPLRLADAGLPARRPAYSALATERGRLLGSTENAICHYLAARAPVAAAGRAVLAASASG